MGVAGAAYATVIGQFVSLILDMIFHYGFNNDVDRQLRYIKPKKRIIKDIYIVGIPAILMQALMSFMTYGVNIIFISVSTAAVTAYGVYYKIQQFVFFAAFGMNNAMIPLLAFNYGKEDKERMHDSIKYGMAYTLIIMALGCILLQLFAHQLCGIFALSEETQNLCITAIRIISLGYLFAGANIAYQGIFQAFSCGIRSLIVSMLRLIVIALPLTYLLTKLPNAEKYLDMGHLEILVLGESLLDGGRWEQVLEYLKQEPTIGENVYVFRCAAASEAVAWVSPQDVSLGEYLLGLLENNPNGSPGQAVTLREVYHEFYERGALSELPELKIYGKELEVKF